LKQLERVFKALGQSTRLKIIFLLNEQELCVCELEHILGLSQSAVSQHMRILKGADLVNEERKGQWIFYSLNKAALSSELLGCVNILENGLKAEGKMLREVESLQRLREQPIVECRVTPEAVKAAGGEDNKGCS